MRERVEVSYTVFVHFGYEIDEWDIYKKRKRKREDRFKMADWGFVKVLISTVLVCVFDIVRSDAKVMIPFKRVLMTDDTQ